MHAHAEALQLSPGDNALACRPHKSVSGKPKGFALRRAKQNRVGRRLEREEQTIRKFFRLDFHPDPVS